MGIKRIVPNICSAQMALSRNFYAGFLGLQVVMDMEWIVTFASASNPTAQISVIKKDNPYTANTDISISIEVDDINSIYKKATELNYEVVYPLTNEPWGVKRFFVKDPNGVVVNVMCHITP